MKCQQGDLAELIQSTLPENIGRVVEVIAYMGESAAFGPIWHVRAKGNGIRCSSVNPGTGETLATGQWVKDLCCPDAWLRPVREDNLTGQGPEGEPPVLH